MSPFDIYICKERETKKIWNECLTEVMYLLTEISIYLVCEKLHKVDRQISSGNLSLILHWKNFIRWAQTWASRFLSWVLSSNNSAEVNRMVFRVWTILQAKPTSASSTMIWENDLKMSSAVRSWHNCLQIRSKELQRFSIWEKFEFWSLTCNKINDQHSFCKQCLNFEFILSEKLKHLFKS